MLMALPLPMPVYTPKGRAFARFALAPERPGEPWWVLYRADCGGWFALVLEQPTLAG
jgi:hypothetical protein